MGPLQAGTLNVRQLDAVAAGFTARLAAHTPILAGAEQVAFVDIDDTVKPTYGYQKEGTGFGYSGVKGLNALIGTVSTPTAAPVIVATRLRKGSASSARGAARLVTDALATAKNAGATGLVIMRTDSAFYNHDVVAVATRAEARVLDHRPDGQRRHPRGRRDRGRRVGADPVPGRDLGRG